MELLGSIIHHDKGKIALRKFDVAFLVGTDRRETLVEGAVGFPVSIDSDSVGVHGRGAPVRFDKNRGSVRRGEVEMVPLAGEQREKDKNCRHRSGCVL